MPKPSDERIRIQVFSVDESLKK